jgi:hypothetical protein
MISVASLVKTCLLIQNLLRELHHDHRHDCVGDPYEMKEVGDTKIRNDTNRTPGHFPFFLVWHIKYVTDKSQLQTRFQSNAS